MKNRFRLLSALLIAVMALSLVSAASADPGDAGGIRVYIPNKLERLHVPDMPEYIGLYTRTESVATYGNPKDLNNPVNLKDPCPILAVSEPDIELFFSEQPDWAAVIWAEGTEPIEVNEYGYAKVSSAGHKYQPGVTGETIQIKEEVDPAEMAKRRENQNALAEYYPVLAESYCGVPVPTPNGTQRLERIVVQEGSGALDLVTEFQYDESGVLVGTLSYFDTSGKRIASGEAGFDEQGRLIWDRVAEDTTLEYEYGEDPEHYTFREVRSGEIFREVKCDLQTAVPSSWIRQTYEQARPYATITLNEDGLPIRQEYKSANGEVSVTEYSYQAQTGVDGTLTELIQYEDSWDSPLFRFDDKGYLVYYEAPNYQRVVYEYSGI